MTTEKQLLANTQNAQLSTGPTSENGKAVIARNAIKHGIFTKALVLSTDIENESETDYQEILDNLIISLSPGNQIESLLVEKIAIDFWRLRRIIRFETGSIAQAIKRLLKETYSYGNKDNEQIDREIHQKQELIAWNISYLECLRKGEVTFDQPKWTGSEITSDIIDDFYYLAKSISSLTKAEREMLYNCYDLDVESLRALLGKHGYAEAAEISEKLIDLYSSQNQSLKVEIAELSKKKIVNKASDRLTCLLGMIPQADNTDKILKYERSLQKSIYQNLIMLKKLQGVF